MPSISVSGTFDLIQGTVEDITAAEPPVVTITGHGFPNGTRVTFADVGGTVEVNGETYVVAGATTDTFELTDDEGVDIDGTGFTTFTSGGTATPEQISDELTVSDTHMNISVHGSADFDGSLVLERSFDEGVTYQPAISTFLTDADNTDTTRFEPERGVLYRVRAEFIADGEVTYRLGVRGL